MLDSQIKEQLNVYFKHLKRPVTLTAQLDGSPLAQDIREFLQEVRACSDMLSVDETALVAGRPSFTISSVDEAARISFAALPLGHELSSFVLAVLHVGGHPAKETAEALERARQISGPLEVEIFISLSCHNCPDVVQAFNLVASLNPAVRVTTVDGAHFVQEAQERGVMAVPAVCINGEMVAAGRQSFEAALALLEKHGASSDVNLAAEESLKAKLAGKPVFDVLVVGAGPAGVASAVYAARKGIKVGLVAPRIGGQTNDTMDIENYISVLHTTGPKFSKDLKTHVAHYGVDVMEGVEGIALQPADSPGALATLVTGAGAELKARAVVLAPGARWRNVNVPGEQQYRNKGVAYCPHCDGPLFKGKRVAVIGGGNSGVEAAIDLAGVAAHVTVLEYGDQLKADAILVSKLKAMPNVTVCLQAQTTEITGDGQRVNGITYFDRGTAKSQHVALEGVFVQIGLVPNTDFIKGAVELNRFGEIVIDAKCHTSAPGVYAAGDATTVPYKQIVIAAGEGAKAALSAFDYIVRN